LKTSRGGFGDAGGEGIVFNASPPSLQNCAVRKNAGIACAGNTVYVNRRWFAFVVLDLFLENGVLMIALITTSAANPTYQKS
jgi:hypothetical protein